MKNMNDDEIERQQQDIIFVPCSICRSSVGVYDEGNDYATGHQGEDIDYTPNAQKSKRQNQQTNVVKKEIHQYLTHSKHDLPPRQPPKDMRKWNHETLRKYALDKYN